MATSSPSALGKKSLRGDLSTPAASAQDNGTPQPTTDADLHRHPPLSPRSLEQNTVRGILRLNGRWVQGLPLPPAAQARLRFLRLCFPPRIWTSDSQKLTLRHNTQRAITPAGIRTILSRRRRALKN